MSLRFELKDRKKGKALEVSVELQTSGEGVTLIIDGWHIVTLTQDGLTRSFSVPRAVGLPVDAGGRVLLNE